MIKVVTEPGEMLFRYLRGFCSELVRGLDGTFSELFSELIFRPFFEAGASLGLRLNLPAWRHHFTQIAPNLTVHRGR